METAEHPPEPRASEGLGARTFRSLREYFCAVDPDLLQALVPLVLLSMALYTRHPYRTNFIFDEQEALLANPYVRSVADAVPRFGWMDAFRRDFWGLGPEGTIGSYRPLPNLVWRLLWWAGARHSPFFHHWVNVLLHGVNGALVVVLAQKLLVARRAAWLAGFAFTGCALLTEAVSGVVGLADVLGGTFALLGLRASIAPLAVALPAVTACTFLGLLSKESALCMVPLTAFFAFVCASRGAGRRGGGDDAPPTKSGPWTLAAWGRALGLFAGSVAAFVAYVELRKRWFPARLAHELRADELPSMRPWARVYAQLLHWYGQPVLPRDPLNNPLVDAAWPERIAGALRVYARGFGQLFVPWHLSGDYSAPQEPIPPHLHEPATIVGALLVVVPFAVAAVAGWRALRVRTDASGSHAGADDMGRRVVAFGLVWMVVSYAPVSNVPVLLPTVRAERFWYFPAIGFALVAGVAVDALLRHLRARRACVRGVVVLLAAFALFQWGCARRHANDYTDDLTFWRATRKAVPRSAKAHLNYSVMVGARRDLPERLAANAEALALAPRWPMAHVYYGDTLCRLERIDEAWPHYFRGFELGPNEVNLIALALQCAWDKKALAEGAPIRTELSERAARYPGTWFAYLVRDILDNGATHDGVDPKYRPRGYNEGPKKHD